MRVTSLARAIYCEICGEGLVLSLWTVRLRDDLWYIESLPHPLRAHEPTLLLTITVSRPLLQQPGPFLGDLCFPRSRNAEFFARGHRRAGATGFPGVGDFVAAGENSVAGRSHYQMMQINTRDRCQM